ncbi:GSCOCG00011818001-RA-CDS, partial [Cotesia congregata]
MFISCLYLHSIVFPRSLCMFCFSVLFSWCTIIISSSISCMCDELAGIPVFHPCLLICIGFCRSLSLVITGISFLLLFCVCCCWVLLIELLLNCSIVSCASLYRSLSSLFCFRVLIIL